MIPATIYYFTEVTGYDDFSGVHTRTVRLKPTGRWKVERIEGEEPRMWIEHGTFFNNTWVNADYIEWEDGIEPDDFVEIEEFTKHLDIFNNDYKN